MHCESLGVHLMWLTAFWTQLVCLGLPEARTIKRWPRWCWTGLDATETNGRATTLDIATATMMPVQ